MSMYLELSQGVTREWEGLEIGVTQETDLVRKVDRRQLMD